ncbi:MAG: hypothetical protein PVI86_13335 [Phycisphaerae bacterium]|jgi:hypothetical protein
MTEIPDCDMLSVHLEEFKALKSEQQRRITSRDNGVYLTIVAIGAALALLEKLEHPALPLGVMWVCLLLGWHYLMNDLKVSHIGDYIQDKLSPVVCAAAHGPAEPFEWEHYHAADLLRVPRKIFQTLVDLLLFFAPAVVASYAYWTMTQQRTPLHAGDLGMKAYDVAFWILAAAQILFVFQLIYYSRFRKRSGRA